MISLYAWTTCNNFDSGDFYSWDVDSWRPFNVSEGIEYPVRVVNISKSEMCIKPSKYLFIPDELFARPALKLCKIFGGKLVNISTQEQYEDVLEYTNLIRKDSLVSAAIYSYCVAHRNSSYKCTHLIHKHIGRFASLNLEVIRGQ